MPEASSVNLRTEDFSARLAELAGWRVSRDTGVVAFHKGVLRALDHLQYLKRVRIDLGSSWLDVPDESRSAVLRTYRDLIGNALHVLHSFMTRVNIKIAYELSPAVARQVESRRREALDNLRMLQDRIERLHRDPTAVPPTWANVTSPLPSLSRARSAKVIPLFARP